MNNYTEKEKQNTAKPLIIYSWLKFVIFAIVMICFFSTGYFFGRYSYRDLLKETDRSSLPETTPRLQTPTQTSEEPWKHFQFNGYSDQRNLGFGIDYPGNWQEPTIEDYVISTTVYFDDGFYIMYGDFYDPYKREIMSFEELVNNMSLYHDVTNFTLNGVQGKKLVSRTTANPGGVEYIFPGHYVIHYRLPELDSENYETEYSIAEKRLDRIINSLYFADENGDVNPIDPQTGWHIYKHEYYSFQYPNNWKQDEGTSCPAFGEAGGGRYTLHVCFSSVERSRDLSKFALREGETEVSREDTTIDGHNGTKQITKFAFQDTHLYTIAINISHNENALEIRAAGIPEDAMESEFALVESIVDTFKLKL